MKRLICALLFAALCVTPVVAQEHPEHPTHGKDAGKAKPVDVNALETAIQKIVADQSHDGWYGLKDDQTNQTRELQLVKVHKDRLSRVAPKTYFACVDMKQKDGTMVDVDFFLDETDHGLTMKDETVHKIDGKARYDWKEKEDGTWERVPVTE
ncbi:MAG: hypothetical protein WBX15_11405 [Thermoanaerobaculia bacterium]